MTEQFLDSELNLAYTEIMAATCPADVFGTPTEKLPLAKQRAVLGNRFESLKKIVDANQYTRVVDVNAAGDAMVDFALVLGEDEIKSNTFVLKNLTDGTEQSGTIEELTAGLTE